MIESHRKPNHEISVSVQNHPIEKRIEQNTTQVREAIASFKYIEFSMLFGSLAKGTERTVSDLDIAVLANKPLSAQQKIELIDALALTTGRPVDLIDLKTAGQPLLNQILKYGRRICGTDEQMGALIYRNLVDRADFLPLRDRILKQTSTAWISKSFAQHQLRSKDALTVSKPPVQGH